MIRQLLGDCRELLPTLEASSMQTCITSPPYYGLRDYGTPPLVWGDWTGSLGLEPSPEMYIAHLVECFGHVRRVLRDDGTLWVNLGDSYAGSGKGPSNGLNRSNPHAHAAAEAMQRIGPQADTIGNDRVHGYKPKDLMLLPARAALALQADGWTLRSQIPWIKRNCMPESASDRPGSAIEYVYCLSKSRRYYYDAGAVRLGTSGNAHARRSDGQASPKAMLLSRSSGVKANASYSAAISAPVTSRHRRNADWLLESWQGLLTDDDDEPLAFVVNAQPFRGAHFATFPPRLIVPMVKASTRPGDVVLDPFAGAGTVGLVADRLGREAVLCELKDDYGAMAHARITEDAPLFAAVSG